jgi:hypothetical protein
MSAAQAATFWWSCSWSTLSSVSSGVWWMSKYCMPSWLRVRRFARSDDKDRACHCRSYGELPRGSQGASEWEASPTFPLAHCSGIAACIGRSFGAQLVAQVSLWLASRIPDRQPAREHVVGSATHPYAPFVVSADVDAPLTTHASPLRSNVLAIRTADRK